MTETCNKNISVDFYKPDKDSLDYLIVSRVLRIKLWKLEVVFYWHFKNY